MSRLLLAGLVLLADPRFAFAGRAAGAATLIIGKLPVGARPTALAGASTALSGDPSAAVWNPAGLAAIDRPRVEGLHVEQGASVRMENLLVAQPVINGGTFGFSGSYMSQPPLSVTEEDAVGNFVSTSKEVSVYQYKAAIAYGQDLTRFRALPGLGWLLSQGAVGATVSALGQGIGSSRVSSVSVDLGFLLSQPDEGRTLGLAVRQIGAPAKGSPLPVTGGLGVTQAAGAWLVAFDILTAVDDAFRLRVGVEWAHEGDTGDVVLRAGGQHSLANSLAAPYSAGLGYRMGLGGRTEFTVEYAFMPVEDFEDLHAVSLRLGY